MYWVVAVNNCLQPFCDFPGLSLLLNFILYLSDNNWGLPHRRGGIPRTHFLGKEVPGKSSRIAQLGDRGGAETRKAKGATSPGAQLLLHGDSGGRNQWWPPRIETHRQACGKAIRSSFLSLYK